jgi:fructosamine-3-kinase
MSSADAARRIGGRLLGGTVESLEPLSGGCIHDVYLARTDGASSVLKVAAIGERAMLEGEAAGLEAITLTRTVRAPVLLGFECDERHAVLGMEWLEPGVHGSVDWSRFGEELAALHAVDGENRYGFTNDNHIGRTAQCNTWHDDWVEFTASCRLLPQLAMARDSGQLSRSDAEGIERVVHRLDRFIPRRPDVSLLHGDLWSGNALPLRDGSVAVIDPSCSYGDAWCDLAMMRLFGGFPASCESAWRSHRSEDDTEGRLAVYQLYHQLNHLNLFGSGYLAGVLGTVAGLQ